MNTLPLAMLEIGMDARVTHTNEAACDKLGYDASEIKGRPFSSIISRENIDEADGRV